MSFDPARYGSAIAAILGDGASPMPLGPGTPNMAQRASLHALQLGSSEMARACQAGLWLYHNFLDESHTISQDISNSTGSFWHAIMHRREPDPPNSNYWWRRVGSHPVLQQLVEQAPALGYRYTTPEAFVAFCEQSRGTNTANEALARQVQLLEWQRLFHHCYTAAFGSSG